MVTLFAFCNAAMAPRVDDLNALLDDTICVIIQKQ